MINYQLSRHLGQKPHSITSPSLPELSHSLFRTKAACHKTRVVPYTHYLIIALTISHRVIKNDGSLGGYRWGIERKRNLLNQESRDFEF